MTLLHRLYMIVTIPLLPFWYLVSGITFGCLGFIEKCHPRTDGSFAETFKKAWKNAGTPYWRGWMT